MSVIAQWENVSRRYGRVEAVRDVSLTLFASEVTALVGHNGAGKTTLIKLLLGLIRPDNGSVRVSGFDPGGAQGAQARRALGFLPESAAFHGAMTGNEMMAFYARLKRCPRAANAALLDQVGLSDAADRRVGTYSKGMRQRLGIAQALIGDPRLLVFDEPTSGLDPASRAEVYETIARLRESGATVLVSTHALAEIEEQADRVAVMHRGRLLASGTIADLRDGVDAELVARVRTCARSTGEVLARMPGEVRCIERGDSSLVLSVPLDAKMPLLRALADADAAVEDVDIEAPGLQQLYERIVSASEPAGRLRSILSAEAVAGSASPVSAMSASMPASSADAPAPIEDAPAPSAGSPASSMDTPTSDTIASTPTALAPGNAPIAAPAPVDSAPDRGVSPAAQRKAMTGQKPTGSTRSNPRKKRR